jgi:hypothetical protein
MEENGERYLLENIVLAVQRLRHMIMALDSMARSLLLQVGLQPVRFPNISQLIENILIQESPFPAVRLFRLFSGDPSADRSLLRTNVSGLLMNNIRYKIKS